MKTLEERKAILDKKIVEELKEGHQITSRTETSFRMIKEKNQSEFLILFLKMFLFPPYILYVLWGNVPTAFYVEVDENGIIHTSRYWIWSIVMLRIIIILILATVVFFAIKKFLT